MSASRMAALLSVSGHSVDPGDGCFSASTMSCADAATRLYVVGMGTWIPLLGNQDTVSAICVCVPGYRLEASIVFNRWSDVPSIDSMGVPCLSRVGFVYYNVCSRWRNGVSHVVVCSIDLCVC